MLKDINILIVDDDINCSETLSDILSTGVYKITCVENVNQAKKALVDKFYNLVMLDIKLPDGSGLELLKEIKRVNEETMVIVLTGYASLESSIVAMNEGAFSYIQKPINVDEVKIILKKALRMQELSLDNKNLIASLKELSLKDALTGLYNYRYLRERLSSELKRAKRYVLPLSIIMIDIDYFKSINDIYGHVYGDTVLREFSQTLLNLARGNDVVTRYGGEEFVILLPDTNKDGVFSHSKQLLRSIKEHVFDKNNKRIKLKISMGIISFPDDGVSEESGFLDLVDQVLRHAKETGGDHLATLEMKNSKETAEVAMYGEKETVEKFKNKLAKMEQRVNQTLLESIYAFAKTIEAKDYYTGEHAENMVSLVTEIGEKLNLSSSEVEVLKHAAILHDLGKIGIPDNILHKNGKLTKKEYLRIKSHPQIGAEIIRSIHFLSEVVPIVLYHHERYDGLGYSAGLKGKEIPLGARIVAIADVYQALTSDRPYRRAYSQEEALKIIEEGSGSQFDPELVIVFLDLRKRDS